MKRRTGGLKVWLKPLTDVCPDDLKQCAMLALETTLGTALKSGYVH